MGETKRLSAILDERVVPHGRKALRAFESAETLGRADPVVLAAVLKDGARRGKSPEQSLAMARGYLEAQLPPGGDDEDVQPSAPPAETAEPKGTGFGDE
jgi:hypothetical protein